LDQNNIVIANKLLEIAEEDLKAAEVLYVNELMRPSLYHLEQASEKILKAYLIGVLLYPMKFIVDNAEKVGTAGKFGEVHKTLKQANNYIDPKNFGHDFSGFTKKFLPELFKRYCSKELVDYATATTKAWLNSMGMNKERIIDKLVKQGATREVAEKVYNLFFDILAQEDKKGKDNREEDKKGELCEKAKSEFGASLEKLKNEEEPCLENTARSIKDESAEEIYNDFISKYRELLDKDKKDKDKKIGEIDKKIGEILGATSLNDILSKSFPEEKTGEFLRNFVKSNVLIFMMVPLQFCLSKYYNATRYGEGTVPEKEFEAIPITIEKLNHIYEITRSLISLSLQDQPTGVDKSG